MPRHNPLRGEDWRQGREALFEDLIILGISGIREEAGCVMFDYNDVAVNAIAQEGIRSRIEQFIIAWHPDVIIVSDENSALLSAALGKGVPVVHVTHALLFLPFGPLSDFPSDKEHVLLRHVDLSLTVSNFAANYMKRHGGLNIEVLGFPAFGHGPWPVYDNFRDGYITLFNPSAMKGIGVFIDLAHQLPGRRFAAVPTWATTQADLDVLADIPNINLLPPSRNVDDLLAKTSVLLMPSLIESMSVLTIEAMLRGIPVVASSKGDSPKRNWESNISLSLTGIRNSGSRTIDWRSSHRHRTSIRGST